MPIPFRPRTAVFVLTALTIVLIVGATAVLLVDSRSRELEHAHIESIGIARILATQTRIAVTSADATLRRIGDVVQAPAAAPARARPAALAAFLGALAAELPQVDTLAVAGARGEVVRTDSALSDTALRRRLDDCREAIGERLELWIGEPFRANGQALLPLCRAFAEPRGNARGVVAATLRLDYLGDLFALMKLDFARPVALHLADGSLLVRVPAGSAELGERSAGFAERFAALDRRSVGLHSVPGGDREPGTTQLFALAAVGELPLLLSVGNDEHEALASWRETAVPIALGAGLVGVIIALVAALLGRKLEHEAALARALDEADDRYQRTVDSVTDAIVAVDATQTIRMFNRAAERMFGLTVGEAIGGPLEQLLPEDVRAAQRRHLDAALHPAPDAPPLLNQIEIVGRRADGSEFPIEATIAHTLIGGQPQLTAVLRDITERRRAEAEQREANRQLRRLSESLQKVREEERTRIARELHDDLGQQLTGLKLELSWLNNRIKLGRPAAHEKVEAMRAQLDEAIAAVRRISVELRPPILDDLGFGDAVAWHAAEFSRRSGIATNLELPAAELVGDDAQATALFRIVQEALTNVLRHAEATQVAIRLHAEDDTLLLSIGDNGRGLAAATTRVGKGVGLVGMRERSAALGGRFSIGERAGGGTVVEVRMPVAAPHFLGAQQ